MEAIIVRGEAKEIAALVLELQERRMKTTKDNNLWSDDMSVLICDTTKDGLEHK